MSVRLNRFVVVLFLFTSMFIITNQASAASYNIIIDAASDYFLWGGTGFTSYQGERLSLSAGTYTVTPTTLLEGEYNAWNTGQAWQSRYGIYLEILNEVITVPSPNIMYNIQAEASAAIQGSSFTLSSDGNVQFGVMDFAPGDNSGSLKLTVTGSPVPLPAAFWLLGSGLLGIIGLKRKIS